jgi:hypothetical protein
MKTKTGNDSGAITTILITSFGVSVLLNISATIAHISMNA